MADRFTIVGIGEALFDLFPDGQRLGGAPLNVAVHAHQLLQARGGQGVVVSRVGQDSLGETLVRELEQRGMNPAYLQTDPDRPTGRAYVEFDEQGQPHFEIVRHAAWDVLQFDPDLEDLALRCEGVCFGTLAQRDAQSRNTIYRFLDAARRAVRLFDVNLRQNDYDQSTLRRGCEQATILKVNEQELPAVVRVLGLGSASEGGDDELGRQARAMMQAFRLEMLVLTRGARGTRLYTSTGQHDGEPAAYEPAPDADSVGAGDACAAGVLVGRVLRMPPAAIANLANHLGAYVASQVGATPALPEAILARVGGGKEVSGS